MISTTIDRLISVIRRQEHESELFRVQHLVISELYPTEQTLSNPTLFGQVKVLAACDLRAEIAKQYWFV